MHSDGWSVGRLIGVSFLNGESDISFKHQSVGIKEERLVGREEATMEGKKERAGREDRMKRGA